MRSLQIGRAVAVATCVLTTLFGSPAPAGSSMNLGWIDYFPSGSNVGAGDVAVAPDGNVYVTGSTDSVLGDQSFGALDSYVRLYASDGTLQWTRQFGTIRKDLGETIAVDQAGAVYVAGSTSGSFPGAQHNDNQDIFLQKLRPDGSQIWLRQFNTPADEEPYDISTDARGNVYMTVQIGSGSTGIGVLRKFSPTGRVRWTRRLAGARPAGLAVQDHNVYVTSIGALETFNLSGHALWSHAYAEPESAFDVAADDRGRVFVTGTDASGSVLRSFDPTGHIRWSRSTEFGRVDVNNTGDVVLGTVYTDETERGYVALRYLRASTGNQHWLTSFEFSTDHEVGYGGAGFKGDASTLESIAVDDTGRAFLAGAVRSDPAGIEFPHRYSSWAAGIGPAPL